MAQIEELYLPYIDNNEENKETLKGLDYCTNLKILEIRNLYTEYNYISNISTLKTLYVENVHNQQDYNTITQLSSLETLEIQNVDFNTYDLYQLPKTLKTLEIKHSNINNINNITQFENLERFALININNNMDLEPVEGVENVINLPKLKILTLSSISLENIDFFKGNEQITHLNINENKIKDISVISTMTKLEEVQLAGNQIEDITVIDKKLLENSVNAYQTYNMGYIEAIEGQTVEIELPKTIKEAINPNSELYIKNLTINNDNERLNIEISEDKTKLKITPKEVVGTEDSTSVVLSGDGILDNTQIQFNYKIMAQGDKTKEVEFAENKLKEFILNYYDCDEDGKITEFDMAQITDLYLASLNISNLKGLEYATNLRYLNVYIGYQQDESNIDISQLAKLQNLQVLHLGGNAKDISVISKLPKLNILWISLYDNNYKEVIPKLTQLEELYLQNGEIDSLSIIEPLTNLRRISIYANLDKLTNFDSLKKLTNLNEVIIDRIISVNESEEKELDYSALQYLNNLTYLNIEDETSNIDANYIKNMTKLNSLDLEVKSIKNISQLETLTSLETLKINKSNVTNIDFIKKLQKLYNINLEHNLIADISALNNHNAEYVNLTDNPVDPSQTGNAQTIEYFNTNGKTLLLTDFAKMQNLTFKNEEFKKYLVENHDVNNDGEISIYEMNNINYLYIYEDMKIENLEYAINLQNIYFYSINLTKEEQLEFIEEINKLPETTNIRIYEIEIDIGIIPNSENSYEISLEEICPIIVEMKTTGSRIYKANLMITDDNSDEVFQLVNGNITIKPTKVGTQSHYLSISNKTDLNTSSLYINWKVTVEGDTTKEIEIEDSNLKQEILKNHDIDKDGRITQNDMLNIDILDIDSKQIKFLKGLENAINLRELYAGSNLITDISPIINIPTENKFYYLGDNLITDISCILNSNTTEPLNLGLMGNYIDFSNENNEKALEYDYSKQQNSSTNAIMNYIKCTQKYGKPEDRDKVVTLEENIKNKLIEYGLDLNEDGSLTRSELYNARNLGYEIDLSNLNITNISGLEYLMIYRLNLSHNNIKDISNLKYNKNIESIDLSYNQIKNITCFSGANQFCWNEVNLSHNQIEDISSIKTWFYMQNDSWAEWMYSDINTRSMYIDLSYNNIYNISCVKDFKHLGNLNLSHNLISDISSLQNYNFNCIQDDDYTEEFLEEFTGIDLSYNKIDVSSDESKKVIKIFENKDVTLNLDNQQRQIDNYKDVKKDAWYYSTVEYTINRKIFMGTSDTTFSPDVSMNRGMFVTVLWRMEGAPITTTETTFSDVPSNEYYYQAVKWATSKKIVSGYTGTTKFGPTDNITREQIAVILRNYANYKKIDTNTSTSLEYPDKEQVSSWAESAVKWAVKEKLIQGVDVKEGKILAPQALTTRAQVATIIMRYNTSLDK